MKIAKSFVYNSGQEMESNIRRIEQDLSQIFEAFKGRIRFGTGTDGDRGENIAGEFQVISDTGSANTEFTVSHGVGAVPIGYLVIKNSKKGVVYDSTTSWTSSAIYLKCSEANANITVFILK